VLVTSHALLNVHHQITSYLFCRGIIFSQSFHFLNGAFWGTIVFNSEGSPIYFYSSCLTQGHNDFLLFYSRSFRVSALTFRSFIHFELFLYMVWGMDWGSFFWHVDIQWFQRHFWRLLHWLKINWPSILGSISRVFNLFLYMPMLQCLNCLLYSKFWNQAA